MGRCEQTYTNQKIIPSKSNFTNQWVYQAFIQCIGEEPHSPTSLKNKTEQKTHSSMGNNYKKLHPWNSLLGTQVPWPVRQSLLPSDCYYWFNLKEGPYESCQFPELPVTCELFLSKSDEHVPPTRRDSSIPRKLYTISFTNRDTDP